VDVQINEAGKDQLTRGIDLHDSSGNFEVSSHRDDPPIIDQHIGYTAKPSGIDYVPACNVNGHDSVCS
jgi:hypothetical protein